MASKQETLDDVWARFSLQQTSEESEGTEPGTLRSQLVVDPGSGCDELDPGKKSNKCSCVLLGTDKHLLE